MTHSLLCRHFKFFVNALVHGFHKTLYLAEDNQTVGGIEFSGCGDDINIFPDIAKADVRCIEVRRIFKRFEDNADRDAQDSPQRMLASSTSRFCSVIASVSLASV